MKRLAAKIVRVWNTIWYWDFQTSILAGLLAAVAWPCIQFRLQWIAALALLSLCIACFTIIERSKIDMVALLFQTSYGEAALANDTQLKGFLAVFPITRVIILLAAVGGTSFIWSVSDSDIQLTMERTAAGIATVFITWMLLSLVTVQIYQDRVIAKAAELLALEQKKRRTRLIRKRLISQEKQMPGTDDSEEEAPPAPTST